MRDYIAPAPFSFLVSDEHPPSPEYGPYAGGALYLQVMDAAVKESVRQNLRDELSEELVRVITTFPGLNVRGVRDHVEASHDTVDALVKSLVESGVVVRVKGKRNKVHLYIAGQEPQGAAL
jgi:hypothetical protein